MFVRVYRPYHRTAVPVLVDMGHGLQVPRLALPLAPPSLLARLKADVEYALWHPSLGSGVCVCAYVCVKGCVCVKGVSVGMMDATRVREQRFLTLITLALGSRFSTPPPTPTTHPKCSPGCENCPKFDQN